MEWHLNKTYAARENKIKIWEKLWSQNVFLVDTFKIQIILPYVAQLNTMVKPRVYG